MGRPRETFSFLCAVLSFAAPDSRVGSLRRSIAENRLSWPWLVRLASEHQVSPALSAALSRCGLRDDVPEDLQDYFEAVATLNRERNAQILVEALTAAAILRTIGITPIFLKGTADLLTQLRPDPGERIQQDIDVLVPPEAVADSVRLLQRNGYDRQVHSNNPLAHHAAPLWRAGGVATIELHAEVLAPPFASLLPAAEVRKAAFEFTCDGVVVGVPSPFARVVHLVAHAQLVDLGLAYGRVELRQLLDLACLATRYRREIDWAAVHRHFANHREGAALEVPLHAARELLAAPVPRLDSPSRLARLHRRRALWQAGAPRVASLIVRLLRPPVLLRRSLSDKQQRRRLLGNLTNAEWLKRQARHLVG